MKASTSNMKQANLQHFRYSTEVLLLALRRPDLLVMTSIASTRVPSLNSMM